MRIGLFLLTSLFFHSVIFAQKSAVRGRVVDENGSGLPFATVYVKGTSNGTTTNTDGYYDFPIEPGTYELVYQYVGYEMVSQEVTIGRSPLEININLKPEVIQLKELVVKADGEDPAYAIIRNAIKKRKFHLNEIKGYTTDVYIKGLQRLDKAPKRVLGVAIDIDTGIVYLSESVSQFSFQPPDKVKEKLISSKVSGDNRAFTFNQASDLITNFYENLLASALNERGFVSPIANNALFFYDYQLQGTFYDNGIEVNKIKVIPKRKNDPVFKGTIYITENSWRIHSLDLLLTKENQIEFVDSVQISQVFAPLDEGPWVLLSQKFDFTFSVFGFVGSGYFTGIYSNYAVNPEFERKYFNNEILSIEPRANLRDSAYWASIRPIPLTGIETKDYQVKDSIQVIKESEPYLDSVDRVSNQPKIANFFLGGYTYRNRYKKRTWRVNPLTSSINFNTVEGVVISPNISFTQEIDSNRSITINPEFRYGFDSERFNAKVGIRYNYNPRTFESIDVEFGRYVQQFNQNRAISPFINTLYTIFNGDNFLKIYEKTFVRAEYRRELVNGIFFLGGVQYEGRRQLFDQNNFTIFESDTGNLTPNAPINVELDDTSFPNHQIFLFDLIFRLRIAQRYISRPDRKVIVGSKYPDFFIRYRRAINNFLNSDVGYDRLSLTITDEYNFGLLGSGQFWLRGGGFLNKNNLSFIDFNHFNGNQTLVADFSPGRFQLLDYYLFSTDGAYFQAHYNHHFNGFLWNKLPLLKKAKFQTVASVNFLTTSEINYAEVGIGLEHIFKFLRVDFYYSFLNNGFANDKGVVFGFGF